MWKLKGQLPPGLQHGRLQNVKQCNLFYIDVIIVYHLISVTCCSTVSLEGLDGQTNRIGMYMKKDGIVAQGKAVYQQDGGNNYLYFYGGLWMVGSDYNSGYVGVKNQVENMKSYILQHSKSQISLKIKQKLRWQCLFWLNFFNYVLLLALKYTLLKLIF